MFSWIQNLKGLRALWRIVRDPNRLDEVFVLADADNTQAMLESVRVTILKQPNGAAVLQEQTRVRVDLDALAKLPPGSLGYEFQAHMRRNGLDPNALPALPVNDEYSFIRAHFYETHDLWHVATGFETDVAGEAGLLAFYLAQNEGSLPLILLIAVLLNTYLYSFDEVGPRMRSIIDGYLLGRRARPLFGYDWQRMWSRSLEQVRAELKLSEHFVTSAAPRLELAAG